MSRLDSPMIEPKKTILKLLPLRRHLQTLFLMVGTELNDFDRHCFPHVDYMIQCTRVDPPPYDPEGSVINIVARIQKVKYRSDRDEFLPDRDSLYNRSRWSYAERLSARISL